MRKAPRFLCLLIGLTASLLTGCNKETTKVNPSTFDIINYEEVRKIETQTELDAYAARTRDDHSATDGVIISPYHTLKVNGLDVPLYATRAYLGIHSFVYLNVNEEKVNLSIEINSVVKAFKSVVVLPLSSNVTAKISENVTTAKINDFGSFSFSFNGKSDYAITVMVVKKDNFVLPEGYTLKEISPKDKIDGELPTFLESETDFKDEKTAYYFKKGHYRINYIHVPNNSVFYFEPGTYIEDNDTGLNGGKRVLIDVNSVKNVTILGNPLFDYSMHESKNDFSARKSTGVKVSGAVFINASGWQMTFTDCNDVEVLNCMLIGYKTCSDGIMLADCKHGYVHHNFCRTGDDAIEAKSTGTQGGEDLLYEYNAVWADRARCYGVFYECNNDAHNIIFRKNSVGFSQSCWCDDCCALMILMGNNNKATWYDIHFEDTEIYYIKSHAIGCGICKSNTFGYKSLDSFGGQSHSIYFKNTTVHNKFIQHEELLYIKVEEDCSLKDVFVENLRYQDSKGEMKKFLAKDLDNILMTDCWLYTGAKASSIVTVK